MNYILITKGYQPRTRYAKKVGHKELTRKSHQQQELQNESHES